VGAATGQERASSGGGEPVSALSDTLLTQSRELRMQGRLGEAVNLLVSHLHDKDEMHAVQIALQKELAELHLRAGRWDHAIHAIDTALALLGDADSRVQAPLNERKAWALFRKGNTREALALATSIERELTEPQSLAGLYNTMGGIAWQSGKCGDAFKHTSRAAGFFEEAGDRFGAAAAHTNLGVLAYQQGRWSTAEQHFAAADKIRTEIGCVAGRAVNLLNLGVLRMSMGDHAQARLNLEEALAAARQASEPYDANRAEIALAQLDLLEQKLDDACRHLDNVLETRDCVCDDDVVQASWIKALVECDRGGAERGVAIAKEARETARRHQLIESEADCCRALAAAYCRTKQHDAATEMLDESIRLSSEAGDSYRRGLALLDRGVLHRDRANVEEAARVFDQLGARYDFDRAKAAL
jgi:tetratricopeptide (TPR) repeat protein